MWIVTKRTVNKRVRCKLRFPRKAVERVKLMGFEKYLIQKFADIFGWDNHNRNVKLRILLEFSVIATEFDSKRDEKDMV